MRIDKTSEIKLGDIVCLEGCLVMYEILDVDILNQIVLMKPTFCDGDNRTEEMKALDRCPKPTDIVEWRKFVEKHSSYDRRLYVFKNGNIRTFRAIQGGTGAVY